MMVHGRTNIGSASCSSEKNKYKQFMNQTRSQYTEKEKILKFDAGFFITHHLLYWVEEQDKERQ